jgi:hypothetical protein
VRIFEDGVLIAAHPVLEGKNQRRVDPRHRTLAVRSPQPGPAAVEPTLRRPLSFYDAVGQRLAASMHDGATS